ncbi:Endochitinase 1, partial [Lachnellula arida]
MVLLLQTLREALDVYGQSMNPPYHFELIVACPAGPSNYNILHVAEMNQYLDFWNLIAYDFAGSWSNVTGDQANLLSSLDNPGSTPFSAQQAISYYTSHGVAPQKVILGMPLYGRSFTATDGL